jgi:hypothetical protein
VADHLRTDLDQLRLVKMLAVEAVDATGVRDGLCARDATDDDCVLCQHLYRDDGNMLGFIVRLLNSRSATACIDSRAAIATSKLAWPATR